MIQPCVRLKLQACRDLASSVKPADEFATEFLLFLPSHFRLSRAKRTTVGGTHGSHRPSTVMDTSTF